MNTDDGTGRDGELAQIRRFVAELPAGRGGLVAITGPAGIGKTFLARGVLNELPPGVLAVTATSRVRMPVPALWPVRQLIRAIQQRDGGAAPDLDPLGDPVAAAALPEYVLVERAVDRLVSLGAASPVAAVLDDAEHADALTVAVLEALSERLHCCPLLVLVCAVAGQTDTPALSESLDRLRGRPRVLSLRLSGLADEVVDRVVGSVRPELDRAGRRQLVRASAGNPLLAQELAQLPASRAEHAGDGGAALAPPALTATLHELVGERLASLAADDLLAVLTMSGRPVSVTLLAQATGRSVESVRRDLDQAVALGLVLIDDRLGAVRMSHPAFGAVLLQRLDPDAVRAVHLRLAAALDQATDFPGQHLVERARHLITAGEHGEAAATACLAAGLYEESAGRLASALDLVTHGAYACESDPATRVHLLRLYGRCLARGGEVTTARRELLRAVQTARRAGDAELLAPALLDLTAVDDIGSGAEAAARIALLADTATALAGIASGSTRALLLARLAEVLHLSDPARARTLAEEALRLAGNDPAALRQARHAWALAMGGIGLLPEVEAARLRWMADGEPARPDSFALSLLPALVRADRSAVEHSLALAGGADAAGRQTVRAGGLLRIARLGLAVADADAGAVAELSHQVAGSAIAGIRMLGAVLDLFWQFHARPSAAVRQARPSSAAEPGEPASAPSAELADLQVLTRVGLAALRGDRQAEIWIRLRLADGGWRPPTEPGPGQDLAWAVLALCGSAVADQRASRGALQYLTAHSDTFVSLSTALIGPVGWFAAAAHASLGELDPALALNGQALEASRRFASPTWTAQCLVQRASLLARQDPVQAQRLADEAAGLSREHALAGIAEPAGELLRSLPALRYPLNPRQLELLRLAAKGLSNDQIARRLYVSTPTVERHLSQIYRTLGVANRAAATRWLALHGPEFVMSTEL